jgi:hypothetical protein
LEDWERRRSFNRKTGNQEIDENAEQIQVGNNPSCSPHVFPDFMFSC